MVGASRTASHCDPLLYTFQSYVPSVPVQVPSDSVIVNMALQAMVPEMFSIYVEEHDPLLELLDDELLELLELLLLDELLLELLELLLDDELLELDEEELELLELLEDELLLLELDDELLDDAGQVEVSSASNAMAR